MNRSIRILAVSFLLFPLLGATAEKKTAITDLKNIIETILAQHPELELRKLELEIARQAPEVIKGQLDTAWESQLGYRQEDPPVASNFQATDTTRFFAGAAIHKALSSGGNLSLNLDLSKTDQTSAFITVNPAVQTSISLRYQLPIFKYAGRPQYHKNLAAALAEAQVSQYQQRISLRNLSLQALNSYYRLLADDNSIRLAQVAVSRSKELLKYQRLREKFGLVEKADRMQTEALVAARALQLQQAKAQKQNDLVQLNRIMNNPAATELSIESNLVKITENLDLQKALDKTKKNRPELAMLTALNTAAQARYDLAKSENRMQLDLVAEIGLMGLDQDFGDAVSDAVNTDERFAGISFMASDMFGRHSAKSAQQQAKLLVQKTILEKQLTEKNIHDSLATTITAINTGILSLKLARERVKAEKRKYSAELRRYRGGRSDTATIIQFEGDLSSAELVAESQNIGLNMLAKQLKWHEGILLDSLGVNLQ